MYINTLHKGDSDDDDDNNNNNNPAMKNKYVMTESKHMSAGCHGETSSLFNPSEICDWEGTKCTLYSELIFCVCIVLYTYKLLTYINILRLPWLTLRSLF
jgi:hypothetical protein